MVGLNGTLYNACSVRRPRANMHVFCLDVGVPRCSISGWCWTEVGVELHMGCIDLQARGEGYMLYHTRSTIVSLFSSSASGELWRHSYSRHIQLCKHFCLVHTIMWLILHRCISETFCHPCSDALSIPEKILLHLLLSVIPLASIPSFHMTQQRVTRHLKKNEPIVSKSTSFLRVAQGACLL